MYLSPITSFLHLHSEGRAGLSFLRWHSEGRVGWNFQHYFQHAFCGDLLCYSNVIPMVSKNISLMRQSLLTCKVGGSFLHQAAHSLHPHPTKMWEVHTPLSHTDHAI